MEFIEKDGHRFRVIDQLAPYSDGEKDQYEHCFRCLLRLSVYEKQGGKCKANNGEEKKMNEKKITLEEQIIKLQQIIIKYTGVKVPEHMVLDFLFDLNFCMNKYNKEN